jgi:hypothetical protein
MLGGGVEGQAARALAAGLAWASAWRPVLPCEPLGAVAWRVHGPWAGPHTAGPPQGTPMHGVVLAHPPGARCPQPERRTLPRRQNPAARAVAAIHFGSYEYFRRAIASAAGIGDGAEGGAHHHHKAHPWVDLLAGSTSGATAVLAT